MPLDSSPSTNSSFVSRVRLRKINRGRTKKEELMSVSCSGYLHKNFKATSPPPRITDEIINIERNNSNNPAEGKKNSQSDQKTTEKITK